MSWREDAILGQVTIGQGTTIKKVVAYTPTLAPASVAAATVAEETFTVTGLTTDDVVVVNQPAISNTPFNKMGARIDVFSKAAGKIVQHNHALMKRKKFINNMRTHKTSAAGH